MTERDNEAQGTTNRRVAMCNIKRLSGWMALAVFATVGGAMVAADPAFAKVDVDKLTIGGEARVRYEIRTNTGFTQNSAGVSGGARQNNESAASHRIRMSVGYDLTPDVSFFAQIQDARIWGNEASGAANGITGVSSANNNGTGVDLHQGYLQVKNVLIPGLSIKAGRQEIIFGDHRLFGNFGWSQIGNTFDGVRLTHSTQQADVDLFWTRINDATTGASAPAGLSTTGVIFPGATTKATVVQDIYGLYVTLKPVKNWTIEPYYFLLSDARPVTGIVGGAAPTTAGTITAAQTPGQNRSTLGGRINGKQGGMDFTYEGAWQFGSIASDCIRAATCAGNQGGAALFPGTRDMRINAHAHAVKTGFTFDAVPMKPRLGFEFDYASGDNDNNKCAATGVAQGCGGKSLNTFDNLFPTNHGKFGYMDLMAWRNMVAYQIMFDVKPSPVSKLQFNYSIDRLADSRDNWYRAGQAAYATSNRFNQAASLGQELDIHYWHTFKEKFKFEIGYGHFFAGEYLDKTYKSLGGNSANQGAINVNGTAVTAGSVSTVNDQNWGYVMGSVLF